MATRKTASKSSGKVGFNLDVNKPSKRTSKKVKKQMKKASPIAIIVAILLLVVGAVGGFFGIKVLTKNDCFEIIGKEYVTLYVEENYVDEGAKVIAFNKDDSSKVVVDTNLKKREDGSLYANEIGTYYITYNVNNLKYGSIFKVQKVRIIDVVDAGELEEIESAQEVTNE